MRRRGTRDMDTGRWNQRGEFAVLTIYPSHVHRLSLDPIIPRVLNCEKRALFSARDTRYRDPSFSFAIRCALCLPSHSLGCWRRCILLERVAVVIYAHKLVRFNRLTESMRGKGKRFYFHLKSQIYN